MPVCSICGNDEFRPAPHGRLSRSGKPPVCTQCHSLERHRIFRTIFNAIRTPQFAQMRCLQFSGDPSIEARWFGSHEVSIYDKRNSLDVQSIDRPDGSYDVVVCNHVLEHVPDYRAAFRELARITSRDGFSFISFPSPYLRKTTWDWGYPDDAQHGHYRLFGQDVAQAIIAEVPHCNLLIAGAQDPVTLTHDMAYLLTASDDQVDHMLSAWPRTKLLHRRVAVEALS